jgi:hypothetical protein
MKRILLCAVAAGMLALAGGPAALLAAETGSGSRGQPFSGELPAVETVKGTLAEVSGRWLLNTGKGLYLLHFGNRAYLAGTGMPLKEGGQAAVEGAVDDDDIVVFKAVVEGKTYTFRDKDGVPLWERYDDGCGRGKEWGRGRAGDCRGGPAWSR